MYKENHDPNYVIVKQNRIVQQAHYSMSLENQKILASLIRSIKPNQKSLRVKFSTKQFMQMLGLRKSGTTFATIMNTIRHLHDSSFWMKMPDGKYHLFSWITKAIADPHHHGEFAVTFDSKLKKYLFNQSLRYRTIYKFSDIMLMQSRYSPRLYEIFRSNQSRQKVQSRGLNYGIKELKYALDLMRRNRQTGKIRHNKNGNILFRYPRYYDFKRRVLKPAIKEINMLTEFNIKISPIASRHRKIVGINVVMKKKNASQHLKREDIIYCITHHIPKKDWKKWRERKIKGKNHSHKTITGKFSIVNHNAKSAGDSGKIRVTLPNGAHAWVDKSALQHSRPTNSGDGFTYAKNSASGINNPTSMSSDSLVNKYAKRTDGDGYIKIYNPVVGDYVWTTKSSAVSIAKQLTRKSGHNKY